jgi:insulysin
VLQAVDNENTKNLQSDMWRGFQLIKSLAKPDHPFSKFSTGNLETLKTAPEEAGLNIRDLLLDFHAKYYSSNIMRVAVYGSDSLDTMQKWVEEKFSGIENKNLALNSFPSEPYSAQELGRYIEVVPVKDVKSLDVFFPMPTVQPLYRTKPLGYVAHLIGHESEGSILAYLKAKGWANELGCYTFLSQQDFAAFRINIALTDSGMEHVDDIVAVIFSYVGMLIREGPKEWIAKESKETYDMNFRFLEKIDAADYCTRVAENMHLYPAEHMISGPDLVFDEDIRDIPSYMSLLVPSNCLITVSNKNFAGKTSEKERWYGTDYNIASFSAAQQQRWSNAVKLEDTATESSALFLPIANPFLPSDFDICPISESWKSTHEAACLPGGPVIIAAIDDSSKEDEVQDESELAEKLTEGDQIVKASGEVDEEDEEDEEDEAAGVPDVDGRALRTWFMQDSKWLVPKVNVYLQLTTFEAYATPGSVAFTDMFANVLTEQLAEYSYYADCGGLSYDVRNTQKGLTLIFYGYHHKLGALMSKTLEEIKKMGDKSEALSPCPNDIFSRVKEKLLRQYANSVFSQPYTHCMTGSLVCLEQPRWTNVEKHSALSSLTFKDFKSFSTLLIERMFAEVFIIGNISPEAAKAMSLSVLKTLDCKKLSESLVPIRRSAQLQIGKEYVYRQHAKNNNPKEVNSAIESLYFVGSECGRSSAGEVVDTSGQNGVALAPVLHSNDIGEWSDLAMSSTLSLLSHLLSEPAFDQLRTKEQLGYIVHTSNATVGNRDCLRVIVQSNSQDPIFLDGRIESFLQQYYDEILTTLSDASLLDNKKACIENLLEKPKNLDKESARYWSEISTGLFFFTRKQKIAEYVSTISREDLVNFYSSFLLPGAKNRCKFSSEFFGCNQKIPVKNIKADTNKVYINNPTHFKNGVPLMPAVSFEEYLDTSHILAE